MPGYGIIEWLSDMGEMMVWTVIFFGGVSTFCELFRKR